MRWSTLVLVLVALSGCSKPPADPVEQCRDMIPKLIEAINKHDLGTLKSLGTEKFEPNRFMADLYAHGVNGSVLLSLLRFRQVPGENALTLNASFGKDGSGGLKTLILYLVGDKVLKIDTYTLEDVKLPAAGGGGATPPAQGH
jgi:hypothetical protein